MAILILNSDLDLGLDTHIVVRVLKLTSNFFNRE